MRSSVWERVHVRRKNMPNRHQFLADGRFHECAGTASPESGRTRSDSLEVLRGPLRTAVLRTSRTGGGIIEVESGWCPEALSSKGAVGLMQLMPATAQRFKVRNRCNIEQNIRGGVSYIAWLYKLFKGALRL